MILDAYLERTERKGRNFVFGRTATEPFTPSHVRKLARDAWTAAELEAIGFHELRHSYSSYFDAAGISETRADRYMGHSNPTVANRYRHQLEGQLVDDGKRLDKYLRGATAGKVVPIATGVVRTGAQTGAQGRYFAQPCAYQAL